MIKHIRDILLIIVCVGYILSAAAKLIDRASEHVTGTSIQAQQDAIDRLNNH